MEEEEVTEAPETDAADASPEKVSGKRLSDEQRKEICELYAAGKKRVTELADQYGVTKSAISQLLKKEGVVWASRVVEEAKAEVEAALKEKPPEKDPTFGEKRQARIEQTREESYNAVRLLRIKQLRHLSEAERLGAPIPTLKETMNVFKRMIDSQINASRYLLEVLEADQHLNESELPSILIRDLGDEELRAMAEEAAAEDLEAAEEEDDAAA